MFPTIFRRAQQNPVPYVYRNPYKAKRLWPPDFSKLSPKHQFRLERRYRRRTKLKWARPKWTKAVKITQLASVTFVAIYGVLFMEWNPEGPQPFQGVRNWFFGVTGYGPGRPNTKPKAAEDASPVASTST
ncbi:hypothetical protein F5884DRAFT_281581 [Xylogone sp. PMI_703]|nr:hypothetical protein F5884DRAFT_281581 [Xylogone sp. PMI_703]